MTHTSFIASVSRRRLISALAVLPVLPKTLLPAAAQTATSDPLPSWNDGAAKQSIINFVTAVTREGSPDFVPAPQRIATFDNDGTLWCEHPMYVQLAFALDRVKAMAPLHPEWKDKQPFKAVLDGDMKALAKSGEHGLVELIMATHAGMTTDEFSKIVTDWLATARDPRFKRPYTELVYQPMLEVLAYLRANGFKTYIVSGGGIEFMRPWSGTGLWRSARAGGGFVDQDQDSRCARAGPNCSACRRSTSSMTRRASRSASINSSAAGRSPRSAIPTAISRCCNGQR